MPCQLSYTCQNMVKIWRALDYFKTFCMINNSGRCTVCYHCPEWQAPQTCLSQEETSGFGKQSERGRHTAEVRFMSFSLCNVSGPMRWRNVTYRDQEALMPRAGPTRTFQLTVSPISTRTAFSHCKTAELDMTPQQGWMNHQLIFLPKCLEADLTLLSLTDHFFSQASGWHPSHQKETGTGERSRPSCRSTSCLQIQLQSGK